MSCFFCKSHYHVSQNCDIYVTNGSREEKADSKLCCRFCLTEWNRNNYNQCGMCRKNRKCYICFSTDHHTVYCPDRFDVSSLILPKIDRDLVPRFMQIFDYNEKYYLILSSLEMIKVMKPMPVTVVEKPNNTVKYLNNTTLAINSCLEIIGTYKYLPPLKSIIFKGKILDIKDATIFKFQLLHFLTPKLKQLICSNVKFIGAVEVSKLLFLNQADVITVAEIFKHSPNIEILDFKDINFIIPNTWPDDILQWKKGNGLTKLRIPIYDFNFNVKSLVNLIKEKSVKNVRISLEAEYLGYNIFVDFSQKMLQYFLREKIIEHRNIVSITLNNHHITENFTLKDSDEPTCWKHTYNMD